MTKDMREDLGEARKILLRVRKEMEKDKKITLYDRIDLTEMISRLYKMLRYS